MFEKIQFFQKEHFSVLLYFWHMCFIYPPFILHLFVFHYFTSLPYPSLKNNSSSCHLAVLDKVRTISTARKTKRQINQRKDIPIEIDITHYRADSLLYI